MRKIVGVVFGVAIAMGVVAGMDWLCNRLFPMAVASNDMASIEAAPTVAKVLMVGGWFLGSLIGGLAAVRISEWQPSIWIVTGLFTAACLANVLLIPHPLWMQIAAAVAPLFAGVVVKGASGAA
ncbi:MAG: hypothetical protein V4574_12210 [Pseudomonadota bacterium]